MTYLVTAELLKGGTSTVSVNATNKADAEYRGAYKIETLTGSIFRIIACRRS